MSKEAEVDMREAQFSKPADSTPSVRTISRGIVLPGNPRHDYREAQPGFLAPDGSHSKRLVDVTMVNDLALIAEPKMIVSIPFAPACVSALNIGSDAMLMHERAAITSRR